MWRTEQVVQYFCLSISLYFFQMYEWKIDIYIYSQNWTFFQSINMKISLLASVALLLLCACKHLSFWICKAFIFSEFDKNWRLAIVTAIRNNLTTSLQFRLTIFYFRKSNVRSENCIIMSIMSNWTTLKYFRLELEIILRIHRFTERLWGKLYFNSTESFTYWLI